MMEIFKKYRTAILLVLLLGAGFFAYTYLGGGDDTSGDALVTVPVDDESPVGRELLSLLNDLQGITFDPSIVEDPSYKSLVDFSVPIPPQEKGRPNPFLPFGR